MVMVPNDNDWIDDEETDDNTSAVVLICPRIFLVDDNTTVVVFTCQRLLFGNTQLGG